MAAIHSKIIDYVIIETGCSCFIVFKVAGIIYYDY